MCHIDVNVYDSTKKTFNYVEKRMIKGGVIIFDDYGIHGVESVKKFVSKISKSHKDSFSLFTILWVNVYLLKNKLIK